MKNAKEMKAGNRLRVLNLLRRGSLSRSELAKATGMTRAAMSLIIGDLLDEGVVLEVKSRESVSGRPPVPVELRPEYAYSLGLTISRTEVEAGVADLSGRLLCRVPIDIVGIPRSEALRRMKACLRDLMRMYVPSEGRWLGLGISTPGPVDIATGTILNPPNFNMWHNICMLREMKDIGIGRVFLENNAQALTIAEKSFGIGRQSKNFLLLEMEFGIGGGIVHEGDLYSGWRGFGSEIGHTSINFNGPRCSCGLHGCMEIYASVPNVVARARKKYPYISNWRTFMDRAAGGDSFCRKLLAEQVRSLGTAIVNVTNLLELDTIVLAGEVLYLGEILRTEIERFLNENTINRSLRHLPVFLSPLGERAELRAAAGIAAENYFQGSIVPVRAQSVKAQQRSKMVR
jgi:predicted NBD/HSP70 family sugar kinase/biotin operon repressor